MHRVQRKALAPADVAPHRLIKGDILASTPLAIIASNIINSRLMVAIRAFGEKPCLDGTQCTYFMRFANMVLGPDRA